MNERVAAPEPSSRDSLPTALTDFVRRRFEAAGLPVAAAEAAVRQLATLAAAQPSASARGWFHERGRLAAELLESDASVAAALAAADLDIAGVLEARAERSLRSSGLFEVINGHHRVLRKALGSGAEGVPIRNGSGGAPESVAALADGAAPAAGAAPTPGAVAADAGAGTGAGTGAAQVLLGLCCCTAAVYSRRGVGLGRFRWRATAGPALPTGPRGSVRRPPWSTGDHPYHPYHPCHPYH